MSTVEQALTIEQKREMARQILAQKAQNGSGETNRTQHRHTTAPVHYTAQTLDTFNVTDAVAYGEIDRFSQWVHDASTENGYPLEAYRTDTQDTAVQIQRMDGDTLDVLSFASYSFYMGYSRHPQVITAAKNALDQYGLGSGSSPLIGGRLGLHMALEQSVVDFFGLPDHFVPNEARPHQIEYALSNAFGFGGLNACVVVGNGSR